MDNRDPDDTLEVQPALVAGGRRPWRSILAVVVAAVSIVVVAALAGGSPVAGPPNGIAQVSAAPTDAARPAAPVTTRSIPSAMACHDLDRSACRLAVVTALGALGADLPPVDSVDVWAELLCGDTLDCPTSRLDGRATPLGSVIVRLAASD